MPGNDSERISHMRVRPADESSVVRSTRSVTMRNRLHFSSRVAVSQTQKDRRKCDGPLPDEIELPGAQRILMPFSDTCPQLRDANSAADLATVAAFTCTEQTWR